MFCSQCGAKVAPGRFCSSCGAIVRSPSGAGANLTTPRPTRAWRGPLIAAAAGFVSVGLVGVVAAFVGARMLLPANDGGFSPAFHQVAPDATESIRPEGATQPASAPTVFVASTATVAPPPPTAVPTSVPTLAPTVAPSPTSVPAPTAAPVVVKPELISTTVTPGFVVPGETLTFSYEVSYTGEPITLILGASIKGASGSWINDPGEDVRITLRPGRAAFTRLFHVPMLATPGVYDVAWGLLGTDNQTSYGLVTRPAELTIAPRQQLQSSGLTTAVARVGQEGYSVYDTSTYDPSAQLRVLVGISTNSATGANQRAFFFLGDKYLGTDTRDASAHLSVVGQAGNSVTLRYTLYRPADSMCCPLAGAVDVRFRWDGSKLVPLDPIPASDPTAAHSRR